jgi:hypothetical protein
MALSAQSAVEYMVTYGWALILITIVLVIFYQFSQIPQRASSPTCEFQQGLYCEDVSIATNAQTSVTTLTINVINEQSYYLSNPSIIVNFNNVNLSPGGCSPSIWENGKPALCSVVLPLSSNTLGQFVSAKLYLTAGNCALAANYLATKSCANAQNQIFVGAVSGHTER